MKIVSMLALSAGLVLAPVAQAQITCAQANQLVEAATEDFASVTGQEVEEFVYEGTLLPAGTVGCQVTEDFSIGYSCSWVYDSLASAQASYAAQSQALADCFGDWDRAPFTESSGAAGTKTLDGVSYFGIDDDGGELTWITFVEEHIEGDARDWHVWAGLDYF